MPVLLMPAGNDGETLKPGGECAAAVEARGGASVVYPDMSHGFASRGDVKDAAVRGLKRKGVMIERERRGARIKMIGRRRCREQVN